VKQNDEAGRSAEQRFIPMFSNLLLDFRYYICSAYFR